MSDSTAAIASSNPRQRLPKDPPMINVTHYADEVPGYPPICGGGQPGDLMSFFLAEVTCPACLASDTPDENGSPEDAGDGLG